MSPHDRYFFCLLLPASLIARARARRFRRPRRRRRRTQRQKAARHSPLAVRLFRLAPSLLPLTLPSSRHCFAAAAAAATAVVVAVEIELAVAAAAAAIDRAPSVYSPVSRLP